MLEWAYSGVDFSLEGNGGQECADYLSPTQRIIETIIVCTYALIVEFYYPWKRSVCNYKPNLTLRERFGRKVLLAGLCLIWGIEIGFKLSTRQLIFLLNPCHVITLFQLILLISPSRKWMHFMFRIQTYSVSLTTIAIFFPVLNTRHLPFEVASYYIHHILLLVTPFYLMRLSGIYNMEPLNNFYWALLSFGVMRVYHYIVLQPLALATNVNIDSILCPAVSDPFHGQWYRVWANVHQSLFILLHGKLVCFIGEKFFVPSEDRASMLLLKNNAESQTHLKLVTDSKASTQDNNDYYFVNNKNSICSFCNNCNNSNSNDRKISPSKSNNHVETLKNHSPESLKSKDE